MPGVGIHDTVKGKVPDHFCIVYVGFAEIGRGKGFAVRVNQDCASTDP